ncbi:MAG TPA: hypothetical protein VJ764_07535 [Steroidobacteraceae bacterium]|nr:hypothetical protein [Steroidobacteraceae bacterium]
MRNTHFVEYRSLWSEVMAQVELESVHLSVEKDVFHSLTARFCHEPLQQFSPQTPTTEFSQNCEAANLTGGLQPTRANWVTFRSEYQGMHAMNIAVVPFVRLGYALLDDENSTSHALDRRAMALPRGDNDCEICVQRAQMSRARRAANPT